MALIFNDRVFESSTTTGTGAFTLAAAITGYQRFSAAMSTNDTYSSANTLTRTTVQQSSNADAAVDFAAGTKYVGLSPTAAFIGTRAAVSQTTEVIAGFIAAPSDKSYKLVVKMPHAGTITEATTISVSGTCTATFKVNSTALGGTANSVSSGEQSQAHASTNTFVAGDDIVLTVSANAACVDLSFSLKYTRTLE
jgi:hypothetical protein